MANWTGQDWALALGGAGVLITALLTGIGSFVTSMVTLYRVGQIRQKVDGMLVQRDAANVAVGRKAGDDASDQRAEGRRQQREITRDNALYQGGTAPVPVADDRVAVAAEKGAVATERIATATEKQSN